MNDESRWLAPASARTALSLATGTAARVDPPVDGPNGEEVGGLYLLHLDPPYLHALHYLGYADDIRRRVHEHASGGSKASPLIRAAIANGSRLSLVRVWLNGDRTLERRLKRCHGLSRFCPTCRATGSYHR